MLTSLRSLARTSAQVARTAARPLAARRLMSTTDKPSVVLLYSGGLDTSCILRWLLDQGFGVHAYIADLGQDEDFEAAREKALKVGATSVHVEDLKQDFLDNYITPAIQCNAIYENLYLLGTSLARPCISKRAVELADELGCQYVSHGATGKGNDQVRFELSVFALNPALKIVAPWRDPAFYERFRGRSDLIEYAKETGIPVVQTQAKPYSMDDSMLHISYEAGILEDPSAPYPDGMFRMTVDPKDAPDEAVTVRVHFEQGVATRVQNLNDNSDINKPLPVFEYLNKLAGEHGVGRVDVVENRFVGLKSRGVYECPAGTVLRTAHVGLEGLCLDREVYRLRDMLASRFADVCYNGFWFSPEMEFILHATKKAQENVTGYVDVELYKGSASIRSRQSDYSLYNMSMVSMDELGGYKMEDAEGFININAHRLRAHNLRESSKKQ